MVISNTNLTQLCKDCGAAGFVPSLTYEYDAAGATVTVEDASTIPAGDGLDIIKVRVHDFFGAEVRGHIDAALGNVEIDVTTLNRAKPLMICATILTDNRIAADGSASGFLQAAGNLAFFDVQKNA